MVGERAFDLSGVQLQSQQPIPDVYIHLRNANFAVIPACLKNPGNDYIVLSPEAVHLGDLLMLLKVLSEYILCFYLA